LVLTAVPPRLAIQEYERSIHNSATLHYNIGMKLCIYCQKNRAATSDHVPPKKFYGTPPPPNLITVPACHGCNGGFGADDEYFLNLALDWAASSTKDGEKVAASRLRSMKSKPKSKDWRSVFETLKPAEARSPAGVFLGHSLSIQLDGVRLARTVNRIIRGLYFRVTKVPLPVDGRVGSYLLGQYLKLHGRNQDQKEFFSEISSLPGRIIGEGAFGYRYSILDEQSHRSFWYLEFYRRVGFVGSTWNESPSDANLARTEAGE
jgi:hypothetical protein